MKENNSTIPHRGKSTLRKRQIVVLGSGSASAAFCKRFRSKHAEVTWITPSLHFAPFSEQLRILSGGNVYAPRMRSMRVMMDGIQQVRVLHDRVHSIQWEQRQLCLSERKESLGFDYLVAGTEDLVAGQSPMGCNTLGDALHMKLALDKMVRPASIVLRGAGFRTLALAFALARSPQLTVWVVEPTYGWAKGTPPQVQHVLRNECRAAGIHLLKEDACSGWGTPDFQVSQTPILVHAWVDADRAAIPEALKLLPFFPEPDCSGRIHARSDLSLPGEPRLRLLGEIALVKDSLGRGVDHQESTLIHQARYLARILKYEVEGRTRSVGDVPAYLPVDRGAFARISPWKALGLWGGRPYRGVVGSFLASYYHERISRAFNNTPRKWV
jgi:hypothetical protein